MIEKRDFLNLTKIGPAGGYGGEEFDDESKAKILDNKVNRIHVMSGRYIDCLDIQYKYGGLPGFFISHGGEGGAEAFDIILDADEYITEIYGKYGQYIDSINIRTNKRSVSAGGSGGKQDYSFPIDLDTQELAGFFGRSKRYLDAIGIYVKPRR